MDEHEKTMAFQDICGGISKADRLFALWGRVYDNRSSLDKLYGRGLTKEQSFANAARREGYTDEQITALFELQ